MATTDFDFLTVLGLAGAFLGLAGVFWRLARDFLGLPWLCPSIGVICPFVPGFPDKIFSDFDEIPPLKAIDASYHQETNNSPAFSWKFLS